MVFRDDVKSKDGMRSNTFLRAKREEPVEEAVSRLSGVRAKSVLRDDVRSKGDVRSNRFLRADRAEQPVKEAVSRLSEVRVKPKDDVTWSRISGGRWNLRGDRDGPVKEAVTRLSEVRVKSMDDVTWSRISDGRSKDDVGSKSNEDGVSRMIGLTEKSNALARMADDDVLTSLSILSIFWCVLRTGVTQDGLLAKHEERLNSGDWNERPRACVRNSNVELRSRCELKTDGLDVQDESLGREDFPTPTKETASLSICCKCKYTLCELHKDNNSTNRFFICTSAALSGVLRSITCSLLICTGSGNDRTSSISGHVPP